MPSDNFKLFMDSAAKSKKEIEKEVQRLVRSRIQNIVKDAVKNAVDSAFDVLENSGGEKIPPREEAIAKRKCAPQTDYVEYTSHKNNSHGTVFENEIAYPHEPADSETHNPLIDKIRHMRELGKTLHNGYLLRNCVEIAMIKQGEFMQDVTDDFPRNAFCAVERPIYGALSVEQLRTYFTWRTDVRRGVYRETDKPYIMLYCYELMNKIGVSSSNEVMDRLLSVWSNCRSFCPSLDRIMPRWLADFYAYNVFSTDFSEYENQFPVGDKTTDEGAADILNGSYKNKLEYLMEYSIYKLSGSIFYKEENIPPLFNGVLEEVLTALDQYFKRRDITLYELICGKPKKDFSWTPFSGAYVNLDRQDGFRPCRINSTERYCIKRGEPALERFELAPYRSFIGYILKATEAALRKRTGFRYGITANISMVQEDFTNRDKLYSAANEEEFKNVIPAAVNRWCDKNGISPKLKAQPKKTQKPTVIEEEYYSPEYGAPYTPQDIEISAERLAKIRQESDEIAKKLIIEDEPQGAPDIEEITQLTEQIEADVFEERTELAAEEVQSRYDFSALSEGWRQLGEALTAEMTEALIALNNGTAESLCRSRGVLPEALAEPINSLSLEHVGDVIIEDGEFVSDYISEISQIIDIVK